MIAVNTVDDRPCHKAAVHRAVGGKVMSCTRADTESDRPPCSLVNSSHMTRANDHTLVWLRRAEEVSRKSSAAKSIGERRASPRGWYEALCVQEAVTSLLIRLFFGPIWWSPSYSPSVDSCYACCLICDQGGHCDDCCLRNVPECRSMTRSAIRPWH